MLFMNSWYLASRLGATALAVVAAGFPDIAPGGRTERGTKPKPCAAAAAPRTTGFAAAASRRTRTEAGINAVTGHEGRG